jgi:hypothetical protein
VAGHTATPGVKYSEQSGGDLTDTRGGPTSGRATLTGIFRAASCVAGPTPESESSCGELRAPTDDACVLTVLEVHTPEGLAIYGAQWITRADVIHELQHLLAP